MFYFGIFDEKDGGRGSSRSKTKANAQKVFADLGMELSTALDAFPAKAIRTESIPFDVSLPEELNKETRKAQPSS